MSLDWLIWAALELLMRPQLTGRLRSIRIAFIHANQRFSDKKKPRYAGLLISTTSAFRTGTQPGSQIPPQVLGTAQTSLALAGH